MPVGIIRGPAGSGKSQWYQENSEPEDLFLDVTSIWAAIRGLERDPETGLYPVREDDDPGLRTALYLRSTAVRFASENGIDGWATTSNSSPEAVERLRDRGAVGEVVSLDGFTEDEIEARLADKKTKRVSRQCRRAMKRWFRPRRSRR